MEINWLIVGVVFIGVIVLIVFIVKRNQKDQQAYEEYLDQNDPATKEDEIDWGV